MARSPRLKRGRLHRAHPPGKGTKVMVLADGNGLPLAIEFEAANHAEVNLIKPLIDAAVTHSVPPRLVYDRAADSDPLRERLAQRGIDLVCPHRKGRVRKATQDGRKLWRYRKRWKIERTIAWLHDFRRVVTRYEVDAHLYHGFVKLACRMICLRRF
jgi:transposase